MSDEQNVYEAKNSLKSHITFLESLLRHLNGSDKQMKARAMWTSWCVHRYFNDNLVKDIEQAMKDFGGENASKD